MVTAPAWTEISMTTETAPRPPGLFTKAEAGSRQIVLQVGLGLVSFVVGSILASGATTRIAERLGPMENEALAWALGWVLQRLWIFAMLPMFGYAIGRFTEISPLRFAMVAGFSGEVFSLLLSAGIDGFESLVADPKVVFARLITLFIGLAICMSAVMSGRATAAEAQLEADAIAAQRKVEYAAFLASTEGNPGSTTAPTDTKPDAPDAAVASTEASAPAAGEQQQGDQHAEQGQPKPE